MQSHNQHLDITLKQRKRKLSSKNKSSQTFATRARWPRIISRSKKLHDKSNDTERSLPRFDGCSPIIDANDSNVISCDIVELFCENSDASNEERMACPRISSSTELEENEVDVCATCKDCAECRLEQQNNAAVVAKIRKIKESLMNGQDEELAEHPDYYEDMETTSTTSTVASIEYGETPILVDLTSEESKQATWKQTILKRFGEVEENLEMSGENVIMSKSSISSK